MSVTNAISSVIVLVALQAVILDGALNKYTFSAKYICLGAVFLTTINIVGGFMLTRRMLSMFDSKKKDNKR
jgi:NAD(P) transhydrogenase subunit alpha